jgi:serine/threonine protein kinase
MSNISYNEFSTRFEEVCVENRTPALRTTIHRDKHKNSLCFVIEYQNLDKERRDGILRQFLEVYNPKYFPELLYFTGKKRSNTRTLVLIFEYFKKLSHYLVSSEKKNLKTLTFKEVIYVFRRVIKILYYLHEKGACHGDIRENNIFINKENELKLLTFPLMNSNIEEARMQVALKDHYKASGVFLPPELLPYLREASIDGIDNEMMKNNDVFCLALMCIRIINPTIFFNSLKMDEMQVDTERLGTIIDALNPYLNKEFGEILKSCLMLNPSERPRLEVLRDILEFPEIKNMSCHSLMDFEGRLNKKEEKSDGDESSMFNEFKDFLNSKREDEPKQRGPRGESPKKAEEKRDRKERTDRKERDHRETTKGKSTGRIGPKDCLLVDLDEEDSKQELSHPLSPVSKNSLSQIVSMSGDENMQEILDQMNNFMDNPKTIGSFNPQDIVHQISNLADLSNSFVPNNHFSKSKPEIFSEPQERTNERKADEKKLMNELRFKCIETLEKTVYEKLRETKKFEKSIGETTYKIKLLDDKKKVGFVINPNDDIYFGYLRDLMRDDLGIFFMKRGDVYHGEFRRGKLCGQGVYLFNNGDVLDGEWKEDLLHGTAKLYVAENNSHLICHFSEGNLVQSTKDRTSPVNDINLTEFYQLFFNKTKLIRNLTREYLLDNYRETIGAKSKTPNKGCKRRPSQLCCRTVQVLANRHLSKSKKERRKLGSWRSSTRGKIRTSSSTKTTTRI